MPAKAPVDENVKFLFSCLIRSDYKIIDFARVAADFNINPAAARMRWSRLKKSINVDDIASSVLSGKHRSKTRASTRQTKPRPAEPEFGVHSKTENALPIPRLPSPTPKPLGLISGLPGPSGKIEGGQSGMAPVPGSTSLTESFHATPIHHPPRLPEPALSPLPVLPPADTLRTAVSQGLPRDTDLEREPPTRGVLNTIVVKPTSEPPNIKSEPVADAATPVKRERSPLRDTRSTSGMGLKSSTPVGASGRTKRVKVAAGEDE